MKKDLQDIYKFVYRERERERERENKKERFLISIGLIQTISNVKVII
ncbi:MAG: hypothetical protein N7Q72_04995 [Spiroplasma sp. Tabriz.8]|nr:hypothetical protein [Spiroplasma sp. Tabriz.8]